jgi:hypothetical protein
MVVWSGERGWQCASVDHVPSSYRSIERALWCIQRSINRPIQRGPERKMNACLQKDRWRLGYNECMVWPRCESKSNVMREIQSWYLKRSIKCDMDKDKERWCVCVCEKERDPTFNQERWSGCVIQREGRKKNMTTICVGVWDTLCIRKTIGIWIRPKKVSMSST